MFVLESNGFLRGVLPWSPCLFKVLNGDVMIDSCEQRYYSGLRNRDITVDS